MKPVRRTLAALALTAVALLVPAVVDDATSAQRHTAWGAEQTADDTAWGIPPVDGIVDDLVTPLDTAWG